MAVYLGSEMVNAFSGIPQSLNGENKTAITTALTNKGVTVPDDMGINDIAALIEAIETGGSSGDIIVGSFTLTESLTRSSPLYIDITFPKNEFPFMYCVFEDTRNFEYSDTSHNAVRLINVMGIKVKDTHTRYYVSSVYMNAGSFSSKFASDTVFHDGGYADAGGIYGSMDINLSDNQIRFKPTSDREVYLAGRTYYYILCWG